MNKQNDFDDIDVDGNEESTPTNIKGGILSLIRTTQRNYINLTNIADNKAHILISINSLMLTILIPIVLANYQIIIDKKFYIPMAMFAVTCLLTIIYSAMVLSPFSGNKQTSEIQKKKTKRSPFFFTNYADLTLEEYRILFQETMADKESTNQIIVSDLYYFGINLASKYKLVKRSYKIFNLGMILSFIGFILAILF
ncbi:MAG: hypothetical protein IPL55_14055 [Saprospiraceae bacterium]|jgi:hypothetical protein|nr:hypothetical protein [Saprospiraceae bacterium]MBL0026158.1 hypothetical protein [Saprospiraceae bacterium]